jgi:iron complex outermembrane receptor protein
MSATAPAFAQQTAEDDLADKDTDVVITVGTRRDERSAKDTPAPVDVVDGNEILNQGDNDLQNLLRTSVPSYNVNTQPISDAATIVRPANLRGLPPDSTLVLVNGKRRHRAGVISFLGGGLSDGAQGADISVIPAIALKQVEVLRDGASSQYGSDAIAGVINFALKDAAEGASFEAEWGQTYEGDGDQWSVAGNVGLPIPVGEGGFLNISAEYGETDATDRSVQRADAAALIAAGNTAVGSINVNGITADHVQIWGQPNVNDDVKIFANAAIPFSDAIEAYVFGNYAERQVEGGFFFRNPTNRGGVFRGPTVDPLTGAALVGGVASVLVGDLSPATAGDCPAGIPLTAGGGLLPDPAILASVVANANCFSFVELFPGGFTPRFGGDVKDHSIVGGFRGELGMGSGLSYDLSFTKGRSNVDFFINNTINASLGPNTPTSFYPGSYEQEDTNFNADFGYAIENGMFASPLNLAIGFEHRKETFTITQGQVESYQIGPLSAASAGFPSGQGFSSSSNGFPGFGPASAGTNDQKNYAVYGEVETDVTDKFTLQAAVRYEDFYDSFGGTTNWKVGGLYNVTDNVVFRSTYSTGFHAPTAGQANVVNTTTQFNGSQLIDLGTIPLSSVAGQFIADRLELSSGVRPTLGPEESKNFTAGVGFSLADISFTVDYYRIKVDNRISLSDQQDFLAELNEVAVENSIVVPPGSSTSQVLNLLDANGVLNAADFQGFQDLSTFSFFTNSFDTRTQGIDVVANTEFELYENSRTKMAVAFNWNDTEITDFGLNSAAPLSPGRAKQITDNLPSTRGNVSFNHFVGPFRGLARLNYYGKFFECHLDATNGTAPDFCDLPHYGGSQVTVDLEAGFEIMDNIELIAGAANVFDSYPDALSAGNAGVAGSAFPPTAPGGYKGGFYYFRLRASL